MKRFGVGVIGCGNISGIYFKNCKRFPNLEVVACADMLIEKAQQAALEHGVARACSPAELLADPSVEIVLNLTVPKAHHAVSLEALNSGKHVYLEKPLGVTREEGHDVIAAASSKGLKVGCAPDTFLGGGLQTCRKLIDDGMIGKPVSATAFMMGHGPEGWHPSPAFYYERGGGPMLDMGPYYLTALVSLIGPVTRVAGMTGKAYEERLITSQPLAGTQVAVETPTHVAGLLGFEGGAIGTIITSFDVWGANVPLIEVHGTEGSLSVPDPNSFGGKVQLRKGGELEWKDIPLTHGFAENSRGLGLADLASAIANNHTARASGELAYHVLDIMQALHESSDDCRFIELTSGVPRPDPLSPGLTFENFQ